MGFVFLACARVCGLGCPACLVVSCGCRKAGREPAWLVLSPLFLLFVWSGWRGSNPLSSPWGVVFSLLGFIRSALPGCSFVFASCALFARVRLFCGFCWGVERMAGVEPAVFILAWWCSTRLSFVCVSCRPVLLVVCFCLSARGAMLVPAYWSRLRVWGCRVCFVNARCCNICHMMVLWVLLDVYGSRASMLVDVCVSGLSPFVWAAGRVPGGDFPWVSCGGERDAGGCAFWVWVVSVNEVDAVFVYSRCRASCFLCEWVLVAELCGGAVAREGYVGYGECGPVVALFRVFHVGGE